MMIVREEIFGPVMSIMKFRNLDEVAVRATDTTYRLAAAVSTPDMGKALAVSNGVKADTVWVNCFDVFDAAAPFGGYKQSGIGREMASMLSSSTRKVKTVTIKA